jgi:hypothetical protein
MTPEALRTADTINKYTYITQVRQTRIVADTAEKNIRIWNARQHRREGAQPYFPNRTVRQHEGEATKKPAKRKRLKTPAAEMKELKQQQSKERKKQEAKASRQWTRRAATATTATAAAYDAPAGAIVLAPEGEELPHQDEHQSLLDDVCKGGVCGVCENCLDEFELS